MCTAIRHLFVIYNREAIWDSYSKELSTFKRGAKNQIAKAKQAGQVKVQEGKVPMPFLLYHVFALALLVAGSPDAIFAHTFLILGWNLMCRSKNTAEICIPHMRWIGDALGICFAGRQPPSTNTKGVRSTLCLYVCNCSETGQHQTVSITGAGNCAVCQKISTYRV